MQYLIPCWTFNEHTRECLGGLVERPITAGRLIDELDRLPVILLDNRPATRGITMDADELGSRSTTS